MISGKVLAVKAFSLWLVVLLSSSTFFSNAVLGQAATPSVKIISPTEGDKINGVNSALTIRGISSDNSTRNCEVSIILNDVKPYRLVSPVKTKDFSSWTFSLSSPYTQIKEGQNKATAKISCMDTSLNNMKWYSINFIAMPQNSITNSTNGMTAKAGQNQSLNNNAIPVIGAPTSEENLNKSVGSNTSNVQITSSNESGVTKEQGSSQIFTPTEPTGHKELSIDLQIGKNPILTGSLQTANISVYDSKSGEPIENSAVGAIITAPSGKNIKFEHTTSADGKTSFSWKVPRIAEIGEMHIKFDVSAAGYESNQTRASYEVTKY